jgi:4-amino-4-deoxy-L-arabinose transferase-like glycosyltransferase
MRLHTYDEPLERDLTTYAVIAHEILQGKSLYSDLFDHKPPAIYVTYALGELIAGYGRDAIFLMNICATIVTMIACYFAGSAGGGKLGGLVSAAVWALASGDLYLEGNQPNTEAFMNALLAAGFCVFARSETGALGWPRATMGGVIFAIASLYKHVVVAQPFLLALSWLLLARRETRRNATVDVAIIALIGGMVWALVVGYFVIRSRLGAFIDAVVTYNRWYCSKFHFNQLWSWPVVSFDTLALPLTLAALLLCGLVLGVAFGPRRLWLLLLAFLAGTYLAVVLPGQFHPHYFQLFLPPLAIGAGWTVGMLREILPARLSAAPFAVGAAVCLVIAILEVPSYQLSAEIWSQKKYGRVFVDADRLASRIAHLLPADATFYEWGSETGLYFETKRRPPSGVVFAYHALGGPLAKQLSERLVDDLERAEPKLVIAELQTLRLTHRDHPVARWLEANYSPVSRVDEFVLFTRKGNGPLHAPN